MERIWQGCLKPIQPSCLIINQLRLDNSRKAVYAFPCRHDVGLDSQVVHRGEAVMRHDAEMKKDGWPGLLPAGHRPHPPRRLRNRSMALAAFNGVSIGMSAAGQSTIANLAVRARPPPLFLRLRFYSLGNCSPGPRNDTAHVLLHAGWS